MSALMKPVIPPPSLPPELLRLLKWLEWTQGRDKLYRLVVYSSKWLVPLMRQRGFSEDAAQRVANAGSALGTTRKILRFFRSLDFLQDGLVSLSATDPVERHFAAIKSFALASWLFLDHIQWLQKAGVVKLNKSQMARVDVHHSRSWFVGLLFGALLCIYKLKQLSEEERRLRRSTLNNDSERARLLREYEGKRAKLVTGVVKNGIDLTIPSARLGWMPVSDATVGMCGTITSIIGIIESYPSSSAVAGKAIA